MSVNSSPNDALAAIADWLEANATSTQPLVLEYQIYLLRVVSQFAQMPTPADLRAEYRRLGGLLAPEAASSLTTQITQITQKRPLEALSLEEFQRVHLTLVSAGYKVRA